MRTFAANARNFLKMHAENWQRIEEIFSSAVDLPPHARAEFLDEACGGDRELREQVEALLQQDQAAEQEFLAPGPLNVKQQIGDEDDPLVGTRVGYYEVKRRIGRGGMGNVYLALRKEGYRQRVAIKVLKRGMDTEEILRRFRTETRVLAALGMHSHIAGLLDAGTTDDGLPYLVMDYVEGTYIDKYCDRQGLGVRERLSLFRDVCSAVQFAHQHAVIHRDLKPSNILVTTDGTVKLIDFGIAKLTAPELSDETGMPTQTGQRFLTPDYASPEQMRGDSVTTSADVYSLGVVLYELLTGTRPFQEGATSIAKLEQLMEETEPLPPSRALRKSSHPQVVLQRQLRGDLDNIVLKALSRAPARRYATVEQLSDDLQRYLDGEVIIARPLGRAERLWRACRRNPLAASLLLAVLVGSAFGLWHLSRLSGQLVRETAIEGARQQAEMLNAVQDFYSESVIDRIDQRLPVTHRYASQKDAIPVPATFTIELGEYLRDKSDAGMWARLYSDFPFKSREQTGGPKDDFERSAIAALRADPKDAYFRFTSDEQGRPVLRYATARTMGSSCIVCHNSHPDSPRNDWQVGEFRGVLEVIRPLQRDMEHMRDGLRSSFILVIGTTFALTGFFLIVLAGSRRRS